ncbi:MFS transporter [Pelagicoccus sp. SDUM812005]|uniref:MFS transporter n=1 Tax=Pelagicoccus sp. SDUM812005 TaxID=3041257 RepID=UPI00280EC7DF|nr:MFS transporter [Pelagicoccus sp. SDUM812005]MDQ8180725.1 MFS transporter [Pelagicoccus sp. SDUM812005]
MGANESRRLSFGPLDGAAMVGFLAYASCVTAIPICLVAITRDLGLSFSQAGGLEMTKGILVLGTLLFSGFVAARFGKARSIGLACLVMGAGMFLYSFAPSYGALFLAVALLGFGGGVIEALINPLVQELHPEDSGRYLNLINAFWSIGVLLTMLGTGEALTQLVSWRSVMMALGCFSLLSGALFLALKGAGGAVGRESELATVLAHKRRILGLRRFWLFTALMFLGGAAEGAFTYWSASLLQLEHGAGPRAAGVGVALFAAGMIVARLLWGWLVPQSRLWHLLLGSAVAGLAVGIVFPLTDALAPLYVNLFVAGLAMACFWPTLQSYAVDRMACDATSAFILLSCGGIVGFASVSWTMGLIGDWVGLRASFWIVPAYLSVMVGLLLWERRWAPVAADG